MSAASSSDSNGNNNEDNQKTPNPVRHYCMNENSAESYNIVICKDFHCVNINGLIYWKNGPDDLLNR